MISEGMLETKEMVTNYLAYTEHIAELVLVHTLSSVMMYNNAFRKDQHQKGGSWIETDVHLTLKYLEWRSKKGKPSGGQTQGPATSNTNPRARHHFWVNYR